MSALMDVLGWVTFVVMVSGLAALFLALVLAPLFEVMFKSLFED